MTHSLCSLIFLPRYMYRYLKNNRSLKHAYMHIWCTYFLLPGKKTFFSNSASVASLWKILFLISKLFWISFPEDNGWNGWTNFYSAKIFYTRKPVMDLKGHRETLSLVELFLNYFFSKTLNTLLRTKPINGLLTQHLFPLCGFASCATIVQKKKILKIRPTVGLPYVLPTVCM
jgi:hypothetical protein